MVRDSALICAVEERAITFIELDGIDGVTAAASFGSLIIFRSIGMKVSWVKDSWETTFDFEDPCNKHPEDTEDDQVHFTGVQNLFKASLATV